jgi:hypothetical protein
MREKKIGINNCLWWPCFIQSARSDVSLQKTFHTLSSLIPIAKVQVSKNLIIWLSIWHCSYHDNSKQTKWGNVVVVDVAVFNRNVYFWRIWFQNGIISNRAIQGQELVLMVNFSLKSNEDSSSHISHNSLLYLYTCLNVSLYYIQLIHKFVMEKGSTIDTIPARSNLNKNIDSKWYKEYNGK